MCYNEFALQTLKIYNGHLFILESVYSNKNEALFVFFTLFFFVIFLDRKCFFHKKPSFTWKLLNFVDYENNGTF